METDPDLIDAAGVAEMLYVERPSVYNYANTGRLTPDTHQWGRPLWRVSTVRAYIENMSDQGRRLYARRKAEREQAA